MRLFLTRRQAACRGAAHSLVMSRTTRYLTGITTTGTPHLGNYVGAIRPTVRASQRPDTASGTGAVTDAPLGHRHCARA